MLCYCDASFLTIWLAFKLLGYSTLVLTVLPLLQGSDADIADLQQSSPSLTTDTMRIQHLVGLHASDS